MAASTSLVVLVTSFWLLVYIRRRYVLSSANTFFLPVTASVHPQRVSPVLFTLGPYAEADLTSPFVLRGRTSLFVDSHASLLEALGRSISGTTSLSRRRSAKPARCRGWEWGGIVKTFYNMGSVTAIVGQTLAVGALWWSLLHLGIRLLGNSNPSTIMTNHIVKRSPVSVPQPINHSPNEFLLRPLIPGVNLPLSHLLPIFVSLMVCTTIHELGHAIAAAADGVPLVSWGYSLILVIPAAFVELATSFSTNRERSPLQRLRITSAGVYHNLITLLVLFIFSTTSIERIIWPLFGYSDTEIGPVVIDVHTSSPLRPHLIPGSILTRIDDERLSRTSNYTPQDIWSSLLLVDTVKHDAGWCVERHWLEDHTQGCCPRFSSHDVQHETRSCFIPQSSSLPARETGWCIDPVPLLEDQTKQRCLSHTDCNASPRQDSVDADADIGITVKTQRHMCITPHSSARLLRISFLTTAGHIEEENTIVWRGPRKEVWEQVTVGRYIPRLRVLPLALPGMIELLLEYLRTVSLSLFLFNLLPIRFLDGGEILSAFLELVLTISFPWENHITGRGEADLEMGTREWRNQPSAWRRRAHKIEAVVEMVTVALTVIVSVGGLLVIGVG